MQSTSSLCQWLKSVPSKRRKQVLHEMTKTLLELKLNEKGIKSAFKQLSSSCEICLERCDNKEDKKKRKTSKRKRVVIPFKRLEEQVQSRNDTSSNNFSISSRIESNIQLHERPECKGKRRKTDTLSTDLCKTSKLDSDVKSLERPEEKRQSAIYNLSIGPSGSSKTKSDVEYKGKRRKTDTLYTHSCKTSKLHSDVKYLENPEEKRQRAIYNQSIGPSSSSKRKNDVENLEKKIAGINQNASSCSSSSTKKNSNLISLDQIEENLNSKTKGSSSLSKRSSDVISFGRGEETEQKTADGSSESSGSSKIASDSTSTSILKETSKQKSHFPSSFSKQKRDGSPSNASATLQVIPSIPIKDINCSNEQILNAKSKEAVEVEEIQSIATVIKIDQDDYEFLSTRTASDCYINDETVLNVKVKEISTGNSGNDEKSLIKHLSEQSEQYLSEESQNLLDKYLFMQSPVNAVADESVSNSAEEIDGNKPFVPSVAAVYKGPPSTVTSIFDPESDQVRKNEPEKPVGTIKVKDPASLGINFSGALMPGNALRLNKTDVAKQNSYLSSCLNNPPTNHPINVTCNVNTATNSGPCNVTVGNNNISIYLQMGLTDVIEKQLASNETLNFTNQSNSNSSTNFLLNKKINANPSEKCSQTSSRMARTECVDVDRNNSSFTIGRSGESNQNIAIVSSTHTSNTAVQSQNTSVDEILRSMHKNFDHTYTTKKTSSPNNALKPSNILEQSSSMLQVSTPPNKFSTSKQGSQTSNGPTSVNHQNPQSSLKTSSRPDIVNVLETMIQHEISKISYSDRLIVSDLDQSTSVVSNHVSSSSVSPSHAASGQAKSSASNKKNDKSLSLINKTQPLNEMHQQSNPKLSVPVFKDQGYQLVNANNKLNNTHRMNSILKTSQSGNAVESTFSSKLPEGKSIGLNSNACSTSGNISTRQNNNTSHPVPSSVYKNDIHPQTSIASYCSTPSSVMNYPQQLIVSDVSLGKSQNYKRAGSLSSSLANSNIKVVNPVNKNLTQNDKSLAIVSTINKFSKTNSDATTRINPRCNSMEQDKSIDMMNLQSLPHSNLPVSKVQKSSSTHQPPDITPPLPRTLATTEKHNPANTNLDTSTIDPANAKSVGASTSSSKNVLLDELDWAKIYKMFLELNGAIDDVMDKEEAMSSLKSAQIIDLAKYDKIFKNINHTMNAHATSFVSLLIMILRKLNSKNIDTKMAFMVVYVKILEHFLQVRKLEILCKKIKNIMIHLLDSYKLDVDKSSERCLIDVSLVIKLPGEIFDIAIGIAATKVFSPVQSYYDLKRYNLAKYSDHIKDCINRLAFVEFVDACSKFFNLQNTCAKQMIPLASGLKTKGLVEPSCTSDNPITSASDPSTKTPEESYADNSVMEENNTATKNQTVRHESSSDNSVIEKNNTTTNIQKVRREIQLIDALPLKKKTFEQPKSIVTTKNNSTLSTIQNIKKQLIQSDPSLLAHSFKISSPTHSQSNNNHQSTSAAKLLPDNEFDKANPTIELTKQVDTSDLGPIIVDVMSLQGADQSSLGFSAVEDLNEPSETAIIYAENLNELQTTNNVTVQKSETLTEPEVSNVVVQKKSNRNESQSTNESLQKSANLKSQVSNMAAQNSTNLDNPQVPNIVGGKSFSLKKPQYIVVNKADMPKVSSIFVKSVKIVDKPQVSKMVVQKPENLYMPQISNVVIPKSANINSPPATNVASNQSSKETLSRDVTQAGVLMATPSNLKGRHEPNIHRIKNSVQNEIDKLCETIKGTIYQNQVNAQPHSAKSCLGVHCNKKATVQCSVCKTAQYCDSVCQKNDWFVHRMVCRPYNQS